jgi:hypothetical protein
VNKFIVCFSRHILWFLKRLYIFRFENAIPVSNKPMRASDLLATAELI